jgi:hypothetical protein
VHAAARHLELPRPEDWIAAVRLAGYNGIIGHGGYLLAIPSSIDMASAAFKQAATACNFGPRGGPMPAA